MQNVNDAKAAAAQEAPVPPAAAVLPAEAARPRLESLDVFRGMTIAAMIVVNQLPGETNYAPLEHAEWNGWTHTDLIFPFFLFIVGVSMALSFASRSSMQMDERTLLLHSIKRAFIIYSIGFFLSAFPFFEGVMGRIRIMGVLQRIALVYLLAAPIYLYLSPRARKYIIVALLVVYDALMHFVPVPGYGAGVLTANGNLAAYIDRLLMGGHLWSISKTWDPEGLLSTMGALATCLIGTFIGELFLRDAEPKRRLRILSISAVVFMALGYVWDLWFPINKNIWTPSYVLFTAGYAMAVLGICHWVIDQKGWKRFWTRPFIWLGANPILAFSLSTFAAKNLFILYKTYWDGERVSYAGFAYRSWFQPLFDDPRNTSLVFALAYLVIWIGVMGWLYRKKIFLRV